MRTRQKRVRKVSAKPRQLVAAWGRSGEEGRGELPSLQYAWGASGASKTDANMLCGAFENVRVFGLNTLREELEARGYDITTLKFSIEQKKR